MTYSTLGKDERRDGFKNPQYISYRFSAFLLDTIAEI